jgi:hypothetical protein
MGTTHPADPGVILAFPQAYNGWGMKLIIHLHTAPEDMHNAGIAPHILNLSTRCRQGGMILGVTKHTKCHITSVSMAGIDSICSRIRVSCTMF